MPRWFRLFEKKRGSRRTGSRLAGSVSEALFFASVLVLGAAGLAVLLVSLATHRWPASQYFPEVYFVESTCTVIEKRLASQTTPDGPIVYRPEVRVEFTVGETKQTNWAHEGEGAYSADSEAQRASLGDYKIGETYACWYDPGAPENVILTRSWHLAFWLTILVCSSLVLIGGGGLIYTVLQTGTSIERRSALARKATDMELLGESPPSTKDLPGIPTDADMTNSPGTTLAFRLPVETTPGQSLLAALIFCLVWNFLMVVFIVAATIKHLQGRPDWLLTVVTIPTMGVGIWSIYYSFQRMLMASGIGPTSLEISAHPLLPGKTYDLFLVQLGKLTIRDLQLRLVCDEEATFRQGTNVRTESARVFDEPVFTRDEVVVNPGAPFECEAAVTIPVDCMHSYQSAHNLISWRLMISGDSVRWGTFERWFPVVIHPLAVAEESP